jgi:hypothetical protein
VCMYMGKSVCVYVIMRVCMGVVSYLGLLVVWLVCLRRVLMLLPALLPSVYPGLVFNTRGVLGCHLTGT